jgi:DNA-binding NarL/FixJ family response regulator
MDLKMPGISGTEVTRLISERYPETRVIVLTVCDDDESVADAIRAGAKGYVTKSVAGDELIRIVQNVMEDRAYLDPTVATSVFRQIKAGSNEAKTTERARLSQRELEVLKGLAAGQTSPGLAKKLYLSEHTIRSHIKNIYRKLEVSSKSEAIAKAIQNRIIC